MSSRRYIKRVWRVPKDRGALELFAALVVKALVKHGWPASYQIVSGYLGQSFFIRHADFSDNLPPDFLAACEVSVRIVARTYRVDVDHSYDCVMFNRSYVVASGQHFREVKSNDPSG